MTNPLMTQQTKRLMDAFDMAGFEVRFVGGCVRDHLLGVEPKDIDFCTDATPGEMADIAKINNFGFVPTGIQHGTATLVVDGEPFEVTTLRVDVETDGRHAEVEFTRSFEVDAERRDLTFNAMSMDRNGVLYDYFEGQKDLEDKVVRFVGDARKRVEEDYLRILRYFRFAARFDAQMDSDTLKVFNDPSVLDGLANVSVERFWQEMQKLLDPKMPGRFRVVETMFKTRVNRALQVYRFNPVDMLRSEDAITALSSMVDVTDLKDFLKTWKLSATEAKKVEFLVNNRSTNLDQVKVELLLLDTPRDFVVSLAEGNGEPTLAEFAKTYEVPVFPVTGQDLLDRGMRPGPLVGRELKRMKETWKFSRFQKTKDELLTSSQSA